MAEETSALLIPRVCLINFAVFPSRLVSPRALQSLNVQFPASGCLDGKDEPSLVRAFTAAVRQFPSQIIPEAQVSPPLICLCSRTAPPHAARFEADLN